MKKNLTKMLMIALLAIFPLSIFAQSPCQKKYFYMGAEGGLSIYHGDLSNYKVWWQNLKDFNTRHLAFDGKLTLGYQFGGVVGMNLKLGYVGFSGEKVGVEGYAIDPRTKWITVGAPNEEAEIPGYNTYEFSRTHALDASINATFDLCNLIGGYKYNRVFHFVPHVGVGALMFTPQSVYGYNLSDDQVKLTPDIEYQSGDEVVEAAGEGMFGKPQVTLTLPVGAEMYFRLHRVVDLFVDYTYNFTFTDKIDRMTKGVDEKFLYNDKWGTVNLGLRFKFVKKVADIDRMAKDAGKITYTVNPEMLEEHDGKVDCDIIVNIPAKYFDKKATMSFTPYVNYNGKQIELESINLVGEKINDMPGTQVSYKDGGTFTFHNTFDYDFSDDEGMKNATISGTPTFSDDACQSKQDAERVIGKGITRTTPYQYKLSVAATKNGTLTVATPNGNLTVSEEGMTDAGAVIKVTATPDEKAFLKKLFYRANDNETEIDKTSGQFTMPEADATVYAEFELVSKPIATFNFKYNSAEFVNKKEANKTAKALIERISKENLSIILKGYASVEGENELNNNLSEERNAAVQKLLKEVNAEKTIANGADWDNFADFIKSSDLKDKDVILRLIDPLSDIKSNEQKVQKYKELELTYPIFESKEFENAVLKPQRRVDVF